MTKKYLALALGAMLVCGGAVAQKKKQAESEYNGGITTEMMQQMKKGFGGSASDKALRNIMVNQSPAKLAMNYENATKFDSHFSNRVISKAVTDQKSSGRCWMFTGMNVLRNQAIRKHNLPADFQFSQAYLFFYDQLEKSNLFLQAMIDTYQKPIDDQEVQWLFKNPIGDGGQFTGVANLIDKYGLVPADVMPETYNTNNTSSISNLIALKLREDGLILREDAKALYKLFPKGDKAAQHLQAKKTEMLGTIYRMLALTMGEPPAQFTWQQKDAKGEIVETATYTPKEFYEKFAKTDFSKYYMVMNDPTREYYKVYEIQYDRHVYDGQNWRYLPQPAHGGHRPHVHRLHQGQHHDVLQLRCWQVPQPRQRPDGHEQLRLRVVDGHHLRHGQEATRGHLRQRLLARHDPLCRRPRQGWQAREVDGGEQLGPQLRLAGQPHYDQRLVQRVHVPCRPRGEIHTRQHPRHDGPAAHHAPGLGPDVRSGRIKPAP